MQTIVHTLFLLFLLSASSYAAFIGSLKPDAQVANISLGVGESSFQTQKEMLFTSSFGGNYYYNRGFMWGSSVGISYSQNPDSTIEADGVEELYGQFRFGYALNKSSTYGLALYAIVEFEYLIYSSQMPTYPSGDYEESINFATATAKGVGLEYRLKTNWLITSSYTTAEMQPDYGKKFTYEKLSCTLGYSW